MTLLTSIVCAFTSLGAFLVVMVDISYIAGCCSLMEDNCEVTQRKTQPLSFGLLSDQENCTFDTACLIFFPRNRKH